MKKISTIGLLLLSVAFLSAQDISTFIHLDQFGYLPDADKVAVLSDPQIGYNSGDSYSPPANMEIRDASNNSVIFTVAPVVWNGGATHDQSGDKGWWVDFSALTTPGTYYLYDVTNAERSAVFEVSENVYVEVLKTAGRMFYYNRCNAPKSEPYAQGWSDGDNFNNPLQDANCRYIYDQTNASLEKDLSGGWFDAGDYNKYVTFSASTIHDLLWAYEENPDAFNDNWNIPESGNGIPDLIDEIIWELDWLIKMNNTDGSTHIKMGNRNFSENTNSPPSANTDGRYYGPTCTSSSIAIASIFAHAAVVLNQFPTLSSYTNTLEQRAITSYNYAKTFVDNSTLETDCDDGSIVAGDADWSVDQQLDEFATASVHLFDLTGDTNYGGYLAVVIFDLEQIQNNFWAPYKRSLNDALIHYTTLPGASSSVSDLIIDSFTADVTNNWNGYYGFSDDDLYRAFIPEWSYHWGSNSPKAAYGSLNKLAVDSNVLPTSNDSFERYIDASIQYFHGINPQGLVYLSNMYDFGAERSVNEIYHTWFYDGTVYDHALNSPIGPAPGFLSGGPNRNFSVSSLSPPANQPEQKSYLDFNDGFPNNSWEISEPAIYYQAAYIRLLANRVDATGVLGIPDVPMSDSSFLLYPNPANQKITIPDASRGDNVIIYSNLGTMVKDMLVAGHKEIDVSDLASGLYFVKWFSSERAAVQKLIIK